MKTTILTQEKQKNHEKLWNQFQERYTLTDTQILQFKHYYAQLVSTNDIHNITAITNLKAVINYHFEDSLMLGQFFDLSSCVGLADVGTGGGFPGIVLKICYPQLPVVLIEVSHKKRVFLQEITDLLEITHITMSNLDWRTFLRKTNYTLDIFCARASLQPQELLRMFKPSSPYKDALLVYWASRHWLPDTQTAPFITREQDYKVGNKQRKLVFFKRDNC
jgi:16S rRNA (guanine(527)-N(7))-methyltransferase RsmG